MKRLTACTLDCPDACSLWVERREDGSLGIRGNPDHPVTAGFACARIREFPRRLKSPHRILHPLLRTKNGWERISMDRALELCAARIQELRREPASILHIQGEGAKGVLKAVCEGFFASLGTSTLRGSLCDNAGIAACIMDFGSLESNDIRGLPEAGRIVNWGKDLSRSSVHVASLVRHARRRGTRVLTVSPGGDGNDGYSDDRVRILPGTDRFLAAAATRVLLENGEVEESILDHTANWPAFDKALHRFSLEELAGFCDVSLTDVETVAEYYVPSPPPVATILGWGLQRHRFGGENARFINALALLSGNIGRRGGGSTFNIGSLRNFNLQGLIPPSPGPRRTFLLPFIGSEIVGARDPSVAMIWVNGHNVVNQAPDSRSIAQAFRQVPFKVVVDAFMTDTARLADLVLPCALMWEQEDLTGSFLHDCVSYAARVLDPPGEALSDFEILKEIGSRLDPPVPLPDRESCLRAALDSPFLDADLETLRQKGFAQANRPEVAFEGMRFAHPDGRYRFPEALHEEPPPPPGYPLRFLTLVRRRSLHSQILPEDQEGRPVVRVSRENPCLKDLRLDRDVFLASPLGRLAVKVEVCRDLHPSTVVYRRGDWMSLGGGANQLVAPRLTDLGENAAYYSQCVRLEN